MRVCRTLRSFDRSRPITELRAAYTGTEHDFVCTREGSPASLVVSAGKGPNHGPMSLLLFGLATCALTDVVTILGKQRAVYSNLECRISAQRSTEGARPFERINLDFRVSGQVTPEQFRRAVDLGWEKYCGVHATLEGGPAQMTIEAHVEKS